MSEVRPRYLNMNDRERCIVRNTLTDGLEYLGPTGERWTKGSLTTEDGSRCMLGALLLRDRPAFATYDAQLYLGHAIQMRTGHHQRVAEFNDAPTTTFDDVKAVFEGALFQLDMDAKV